jgi:putative tryptophan/tyrosine transport system substrate-binding protein
MGLEGIRVLFNQLKRREFITLLGGAAVTWPLAARAQQRGRKMALIGIIDDAPIWNHFRKGLRDLGYIEGENIEIQYQTAHGEPARLLAAAKQLAGIPVDVIVEFGTPAARAAKMATSTIPIVMISIGDPVRAGFVASLARPGANMTGDTNVGPDVWAKRVQMLKELIPSVSRVAYLWNPDNASTAAARDELQIAEPRLGLKLIWVGARTVGELDAALAAMMSEHPDAVSVSVDPFHQLHLQRILDFLAEHRLPGMFQTRENVLAGGLMSYGPSLPDLFRRAATYVHKILQGAKPSELPVEQPVSFELIVNLRTAKMLGITIPESFLLRADDVIE